MTRPTSALIAIVFLLSACGGTPSATNPGAGTNPTPAAPPLATGPAATTTGGGGTGAGDLCLNTPEEVSAALQIGSVTATGNQSAAGGGCFYVTADNMGYAIAVIIGPSAAVTIQNGLATAGAIEITGIGDQAVLMSPGGPLVVRKGDTIISQGPAGSLPILADAAAARKAMEDLARAAVGRLGQ